MTDGTCSYCKFSNIGRNAMNTTFKQIENMKEYVEEKLSTGELEPQTYNSS